MDKQREIAYSSQFYKDGRATITATEMRILNPTGY